MDEQYSPLVSCLGEWWCYIHIKNEHSFLTAVSCTSFFSSSPSLSPEGQISTFPFLHVWLILYLFYYSPDLWKLVRTPPFLLQTIFQNTVRIISIAFLKHKPDCDTSQLQQFHFWYWEKLFLFLFSLLQPPCYVYTWFFLFFSQLVLFYQPIWYNHTENIAVTIHHYAFVHTLLSI